MLADAGLPVRTRRVSLLTERDVSQIRDLRAGTGAGLSVVVGIALPRVRAASSARRLGMVGPLRPGHLCERRCSDARTRQTSYTPSGSVCGSGWGRGGDDVVTGSVPPIRGAEHRAAHWSCRQFCLHYCWGSSGCGVDYAARQAAMPGALLGTRGGVEPPSTPLRTLEAPDDEADELRLSCWSLTGAGAISAYEGRQDRLRTCRPGEKPVAVLRMPPVRNVWTDHLMPGDWAVAEPLLVALDVAQLSESGAAMLASWVPPDPACRFW